MSARTNASHPIATIAVMAAFLALAACAPSLPAGTRACVGFPASVCQSQIADLEREGVNHGGVAAYRLVCTIGSCTAERGEGMLTVVFNDGTGREGTFGYATPVATPPDRTEPPLAVVPTCLGVPKLRCEDFARAEAGRPGFIGKTVTSITVRCTSTCTETRGDGETRLTFTDGADVTVGWTYGTGD